MHVDIVSHLLEGSLSLDMAVNEASKITLDTYMNSPDEYYLTLKKAVNAVSWDKNAKEFTGGVIKPSRSVQYKYFSLVDSGVILTKVKANLGRIDFSTDEMYLLDALSAVFYPTPKPSDPKEQAKWALEAATFFSQEKNKIAILKSLKDADKFIYVKYDDLVDNFKVNSKEDEEDKAKGADGKKGTAEVMKYLNKASVKNKVENYYRDLFKAWGKNANNEFLKYLQGRNHVKDIKSLLDIKIPDELMIAPLDAMFIEVAKEFGINASTGIVKNTGKGTPSLASKPKDVEPKKSPVSLKLKGEA